MPFDEDDKDDSVWFLDHDYLENMYNMFKKVNGKSRVLCKLVCILITLDFTLQCDLVIEHVFRLFQQEKE